MSVYRGYDWFIVDDFGDIWNEEALPTFDQAYSYRGKIKYLLNRITELRIICRSRGDISVRDEPKNRQSTYAADADF